MLRRGAVVNSEGDQEIWSALNPNNSAGAEILSLFYFSTISY